MTAIKSKKKTVQVALSTQTYQKILKLIGDDAPFQSMSEYLYTVIISDLARREMGGVTLKESMIQMLQEPEIQQLIQEIASQK